MKWNFLSYLQTSDQKTTFAKYSHYLEASTLSSAEHSSFSIGSSNGIIFPTYRLLIKKLLLQNISHSTRRVQNQLCTDFKCLIFEWLNIHITHKDTYSPRVLILYVFLEMICQLQNIPIT